MGIPPVGDRTCLYRNSELDAVLNNMAWQAGGLIRGKKRVVLVGIVRRGVPLSEMLHARLSSQHGITNITMMQLHIKRYADDLTLLYPETKQSPKNR